MLAIMNSSIEQTRMPLKDIEKKSKISLIHLRLRINLKHYFFCLTEIT